MPIHKYFCPDCGLVLQSAADVAGKVVKCLGCQAVFTAKLMNQPGAAQAPRPAEPTPRPRQVEGQARASAPRPVEQLPPAPPKAERQIEGPVPPPYVDPPEEVPEPPPARKPAPPRPRPVARVQKPAEPEDEETIDLEPVRDRRRKKPRWGLIIGLVAGLAILCATGGVGLYLVFGGSSMKYQLDAPDKAWTIKLPDNPETKHIAEGQDQYVYSRAGKDAEFVVEVEEKQEASPEEMFDLQAGFLLLGMAEKYKVEPTNLMSAKGLVAPYDGKHPRRRFEIDTGSRGKLTIQVIAANWGTNKSTIFIQAVIGKDVSDSERKAFLDSVQVKKGVR